MQTPCLFEPGRLHSRLVSENFVDLGKNLRRQKWKHLETLDVVHNLLGPGGTGDDGAHVFVLDGPGKSEVGLLDSELIGDGLEDIC
jgi:hypothetical protein